jgi:hypothetical protein
MHNEVSNKVVVILLIFAFVFSIGGTFIIYDSVSDYKEGKVQVGGNAAATGMITLEVEEYDEEVGNTHESI